MLLGIVLFSTIACDSALPEGCKAGDLKVGMLSDAAGLDDAGFNASTWAGLQKADTNLAVCTSFVEGQDQADYEQNIVDYVKQGYDMIVTVGFLLIDATQNMSKQYPDVKFVVIDHAYDPPIPNVAGITFNVDEAAFPAGYLAAGWAALQDPEDPQVGYVGGMQIPPVEQFIVAYEAGVAYYNAQKSKHVEVKGTYIDDFEAFDQGRIQGNLLIDAGVDVILGVGGKTGNGCLAAAKERNKWGIGADVDQYLTLPSENDILITSCMKRLDNAVYSVVESTANGAFPGGSIYLGTLKNDGVGLAPYHDYEDRIPAKLKVEVDAIVESIKAGEIDTGW